MGCKRVHFTVDRAVEEGATQQVEAFQPLVVHLLHKAVPHPAVVPQLRVPHRTTRIHQRLPDLPHQ